MIAVVTGILYAIVIHVPTELFNLALTIAVVVLVFAMVTVVVDIVRGMKKDFGKLVSTMEIPQQNNYIIRNLKFFYPIVGIGIVLSLGVLAVNCFYRQFLYNTHELSEAKEMLTFEISYDFQWGMYAIEVMLLLIACIACKCILFYKAEPLLRFCFCQDNFVNVNVKMNGVELRQVGTCIRILNEKEERLFIEDNGIVLIYNENTKEFVNFSSEGVTSIVFVKQDNSPLATLRFVGGRWAKF